MGQVIQLHKATPAKAKGAGIAVAIMATRYGFDADESRKLGVLAKSMVECGYSAAHARSVILRRVRRRAPQPEVA